MNKISYLPLSSFGPLGCNVTILYFFITPNNALKQKLSKQMEHRFKELNLHFF
jgi:hypothetical protein